MNARARHINEIENIVKSSSMFEHTLENFNDVTVLDDIIPILKVPNNYEFYYEINNLAMNLNANDKYLNEIRRLGLEAMGGD